MLDPRLLKSLASKQLRLRQPVSPLLLCLRLFQARSKVLACPSLPLTGSRCHPSPGMHDGRKLPDFTQSEEAKLYENQHTHVKSSKFRIPCLPNTSGASTAGALSTWESSPAATSAIGNQHLQKGKHALPNKVFMSWLQAQTGGTCLAITFSS